MGGFYGAFGRLETFPFAFDTCINIGALLFFLFFNLFGSNSPPLAAFVRLEG